MGLIFFEAGRDGEEGGGRAEGRVLVFGIGVLLWFAEGNGSFPRTIQHVEKPVPETRNPDPRV